MASINSLDELYEKTTTFLKRGQKLQGILIGANLCLAIGVALLSLGFTTVNENLKISGICLWGLAAIFYLCALGYYICISVKKD